MCKKRRNTVVFDRPAGSSTDSQWGDNKIGVAGSSFYKDEEVISVNKFRTTMIGEDEKLSNPDDNTSLIMIQRGKKGAVIVNVSNKETKLTDVETDLTDGAYKDKVSGKEFKVKMASCQARLKRMLLLCFISNYGIIHGKNFYFIGIHKFCYNLTTEALIA